MLCSMLIANECEVAVHELQFDDVTHHFGSDIWALSENGRFFVTRQEQRTPTGTVMEAVCREWDASEQQSASVELPSKGRLRGVAVNGAGNLIALWTTTEQDTKNELRGRIELVRTGKRPARWELEAVEAPSERIEADAPR